MYIKVDADGNPEGYPISYENIQYLVGPGNVVTPEMLAEFNLAIVEDYNSPPAEQLADVDSNDIERLEIAKDEDGKVRQLWSVTEISLKEKIRRWVSPARGSYLIRSDWTQVADAPLTPEEKAAWAEWRGKLRSITEDVDFNAIHRRADFNWPPMPGALDTADTKWADTPSQPPPDPQI